MPKYEYKCKKCGIVFEQMQKITDDPLKKCPTCKGPVQRLISASAGLVFKGKGFYKTDYKDNVADKPVPPCGSSQDCSTCQNNK